MKAFLKLIRWQNLLIIILAMGLMRYGIIASLLGRMSVTLYSSQGKVIPVSLQMPLIYFIILIIAVVLIAAGGYVINDYFDIKTDLINRGKVIVGTKIPRRQAMMWHNILNIAGVASGFYVSWKSGYFWMGILFLMVSGLLYFYSASYKRQFLIGNIIVATLTAMVPMLVVLYEAPWLYNYYTLNAISVPEMGLLFWWIGGFAVFSFISTLTREIIKDIEDFEGDVAYGRNTIPVVIGILASKIISVCLIIITIAMLLLTCNYFINDYVTLAYMAILIIFPLLLVIYMVIAGKSRKELHSASRIMKLVMIAGILYSVMVMILLRYNIV